MSKTEELIELIEQISKQKTNKEEMKKRRDILDNILKAAVDQKDWLMVKLAVLLGADVTAYDNYAIQIASEDGRTEVVKLLINNGADVTANDNCAIHMASENDHEEVVKLLIENGAAINIGLIAAAEIGKKGVVELLIENGADVTVNDNRAVKEAFDGGHAEIVELLIKAGASFS